MLREFTRVAWASEALKRTWEPRVAAIRDAWLDIELTSVAQGYRDCALVFGWPAFADRCKELNLLFLIVSDNRYLVFRRSRMSVATDFFEAWDARNDKEIGRLLGFPSCCQEFFDEVWNVEKKRDTTLSMRDAGAVPTTNILGRWLGIRFMSHLPCSWRCAETLAQIKSRESLWREPELTWAHEWLSWPVRYSALHGIAVITNPVCKITTSTDYTAQEARLDVPGTSYPEDAPHGLDFPFQRPAFTPITSLKPFVQSVRVAAGDSLWRDNGFSSLAAMRAAHASLIATLKSNPPAAGAVVDFGCGNGELLRSISRELSIDVDRLCGVEFDANKFDIGAQPRIVVGDLSHVEMLPLPKQIDTILVSQRRFEEIPSLEAWCLSHARQVLVYSYDAPQFARMTVCALN